MLEKEFLLHKIARLENGNKFDKNKMTYKNPSVNFVSRTSKNNGISDYVDKIINVEPYPKGAITLAFGGSIGSTFLQEEPFYTGQNVGVIILDDSIDYNTKLYIITAIEKLCKKRFTTFSDEINKYFKTNLSISLPVKTDNNTPIIDLTCKWNKEGYIPDFDCMKEKIIELKQEIIIDLEREKKKELKQYLKVTGLDNYELTKQEIELLSLCKEDDNKKTIQMREFRCGTLFDINPTKSYKISIKDLDEISGKTPILSNSSMNNGIGGYSSLRATEQGGIITFSDTTTGPDTMFYQSDDFIGYSHVQGMYPYDKENWGEYSLRYFICAMKRASGTFWNYSIKFNRKLVAEIQPLLPIQADRNNNPILDKECKYHKDGYIPDWDFMKKYIKLIEKNVITDVIKHKDTFIEQIKILVNE